MWIDTLKFARRMIEAGMERQQAEALAEEFADLYSQVPTDPACPSGWARRRDLQELDQRTTRNFSILWLWLVAISFTGFTLLIVVLTRIPPPA